MGYRWQAPGNGKIFDDRLGSNSYMNKRTICVLKYIKEKKASQKQFELEIKSYLEKCADYKKNESMASHFFRPLLFLGFIQQDINSNLDLTIEGEKFLEAYEKKEFEKCKVYILNQLDNTKYPNKATKKVKLYLFPFRILFKLLLENNKIGIDINFMKTQLVYIKTIDDLKGYIKSKKLTDIKKHKPYDKFYTWVINSLVDIEVLKKDSNKYFIADDLLDKVKNLYENVEYETLFFDEKTISCEININVSRQRYKRNPKVINEAKQRDNYLCQVHSNHKTFISNGHNYVEGHHIIPMFQQKNYDFKLDEVDNIISLCPNCHKEIHFADNKKEIIQKIFNLNKKYMEKHSVSLNDLYKMYMCV